MPLFSSQISGSGPKLHQATASWVRAPARLQVIDRIDHLSSICHDVGDLLEPPARSTHRAQVRQAQV